MGQRLVVRGQGYKGQDLPWRKWLDGDGLDIRVMSNTSEVRR
jgi:hypothetical protein